MMYAQVMKLLRPYMKISGSNLEIMRSAFAEHRQIFGALADGDQEKAQEAFKNHLRGSRDHLEALVSADI